jgi:hypothetical protein
MQAAADKFSFPKSKIRVLLLEGIHKAAGDAFRADGYQGERRQWVSRATGDR